MKTLDFIIAPDSFKDSLSATEACEIIFRALDDCGVKNLIKFPIADGGEGTAEFFSSFSDAKRITATVCDPLGRKIDAKFVINGKTAFIETAEACGLTLLGENERNPLKTSTFGAGELVLNALKSGVEEIYITLGGSATNDGGTGFLSALGGIFYDKNRRRLPEFMTGENLSNIDDFDLQIVENVLKNVTINVICDVLVPLCGENGAALMFSPQKGADDFTAKLLDKNLEHFANIIYHKLNIDVKNTDGAGAAGGFGAALLCLNAKIISGIDFILDYANFDKYLTKSSVVITGEGCFDNQTLNGKAIFGILSRAKKHETPVYIFCGKNLINEELSQKIGVKKVVCITPSGQNQKEAMQNAKNNLYNSVFEFFRKF